MSEPPDRSQLTTRLLVCPLAMSGVMFGFGVANDQYWTQVIGFLWLAFSLSLFIRSLRQGHDQ